MKIAFYDLDGTLLDSLHRFQVKAGAFPPVIDLDHWKEREHLAHLDQVIPGMARKFKADMINPDIITAISTNRYYCENTRAVMDQAGLIPDFISARTHEKQRSKELKQDFMRDLMIELQINEAVFYDDNIRILREVKAAIGAAITCIYKPSDQGF